MNLYLIIIFILLVLIVQIERIWINKFYSYLKGLPIMLLLLIVFFHLSSGLSSNNLAFSIILYFFIGLSFGLLGDLLLLKKKLFYAGLFAFLIGHLFYIFVFLQFQIAFIPEMFYIFIPAILYGMFLLYNIIKNKKRKIIIIPLFTYILVISFMLISAINFELSLLNYFPWFILGASLFALSDAMLAWNKFVRSGQIIRTLYSLLYYTAQFILTYGLLTYL